MDEPIRITGCPLCRIFSDREIITKLYWPENIEDIPKSEFVIVDCKTCNIPMVVIGEHLTTINRECWGRILYRSKKIFGRNIRLKRKMITIRDHLHFHLYDMDKYK